MLHAQGTHLARIVPRSLGGAGCRVGAGAAAAAGAGRSHVAKPGLLAKIGIDQRLNQQVPLDLPFVDETGTRRQARRLLRQAAGAAGAGLLRVPDAVHAGAQRRHRCAQGAELRRRQGIRRRRGQHQPARRAGPRGAEEAGLRRALRRPADGGRLALPDRTRGEHPRPRRTRSGFRYEYDEEIKQYAHGAGVELLTPKGVIARYFYGIEYSPRDIRLGIIEASEERIGSPIDSVAAALLSLRSGDREVRRRGDRRWCGSARCDDDRLCRVPVRRRSGANAPTSLRTAAADNRT